MKTFCPHAEKVYEIPEKVYEIPEQEGVKLS